MATKQDVLKSIKAHRLYKDYYSPTKEIPRTELEGEVNPTGQALERLLDLKRRLKVATTRQTDFPPALVRDGDEIQQQIQTVIVTLLQEGDGQIDNATFQKYFEPLAGMVEGYLSTLHQDDPGLMMDLRSMKRECVTKAFYRTLRKLIESGVTESKKGHFELAKALSSLNTHVFIQAEKTGRLNKKLIEHITSLLDQLSEKATDGCYNYADELKAVRGWKLVEEKVDTTTPGQPTGEKRWKGDTCGAGAKADVRPNELLCAPGNPKDDTEGTEPAQKNSKKMDGGIKTAVDGKKTNKPGEKPVPKQEQVELEITEETPVKICYVVKAGGQPVGEATFNRRSKKGTILATLEWAGKKQKVDAVGPFWLRVAIAEKLNEMAEGARFSA